MAGETRQRILDVALEMFGDHGYAGTSVGDITKRLGISKAALYHHFAAKSDILEALLAGPLAGYRRLIETAPGRPLDDLLGAIVDTTVEVYTVSRLIGDDPSVRRAMQERAARPEIREINDALTAALGGGVPPARAHAAYAAVKNGSLALLAATGKRPTPADRAELVAAALRALG